MAGDSRRQRRSARWGWRTRAREGAPSVGEIATLVHRLAVLLAAGVAPAQAWRHVGQGSLADVGAHVANVAARDGPTAIPDAIDGLAQGPMPHRAGATRGPVQSAWTGLAASWSVSAWAGAPLAPTLRAYAELLRGFSTAERDRRIALAGPRATSRLVLVLPFIAALFGALLGQDTIGVLVASPTGWACLAIGGALGFAGWAWTRWLLRRAATFDQLPGFAEELTAVAMAGGVSVVRARELVVRALDQHGVLADLARTDAALALAAASGAPAGELLRADAEERRREALADAKERAERLSVTLMLPLGVCVLPAFVAVGVVPLMVAVVGSTLQVV